MSGMTLETLKVIIEANHSRFEKAMNAVKSTTQKARDQVEKNTSSMKKNLDGVGSGKAQQNIETLTNKLNRQKESISKQQLAVEQLKQKYDALLSGETKSSTISGLTNDLKTAEKEFATVESQMQGLLNKLNEAETFEAAGLNVPGMDQVRADIEALNPQYDALETKIETLKQKLAEARMNPEGTAEAQRLGKEIELAEQKLSRLNNEATQTQQHLDQAFSGNKLTNTKKKIEDANKSVKKLNNNLKNTKKTGTNGFDAIGKKVDRLTKRITSLALSAFLLNGLSKAFRSMAEYMSGCLKTNAQFNNSVSQIKTNLQVAFAPIYNAILPAINALMSALAKATAYIATFINMLFGKTYADGLKAAQGLNTAKKAMDSYGSSAKKATKETKGTILAFDEVHTLNKEDDTDSGGGGGAELTPTDVDTGAAESKISDFFDKIKAKLKPLLDLFKEGFKAGLGDDFADRVQNIRDNLKLLGDALKDIFTDPRVVASAQNLTKTMAYALGQMAGAAVSVGVTIAQNLVGGIAKYFDQNRERVKLHLITMFDVTAEIWKMAGDYAQAFANVFSAFGGENGQQSTANIIGIFADTFMGIQELAAKRGRDTMDVFTRPFIENQEGLKTALDGILGVVASVTGTIKQCVDDTFDGLNSMYDAHIAPFIQGIAGGLSELTAHFLEFWNGKVKPMLDEWAVVFDQTVGQHIQPLIDNIISLIGSVADALSALWQNIVKPFIDWIIANILPVLMPILSTIVETVMAVVGNIADFLGGLIQVITGVIDFIVGIFTGDWEKAWTGIQEIVTGIMNAIKAVIELVMNTIGGVIRLVLNTISAIFTTVFTAIGSFVKTVFTTMMNVIKTITTNIKTGISTTLNTIKTVWSNIFNSIKTTTVTIFTGIWDAIRGVINSILGGIEAMCNGVIGGINAVVKAMNNLSFDIPDWVPEFGGKKFGFNIPTLSNVSLPRLAKGGIVDRSTIAMIGEAGKEAVLPLENNTGWMETLATKLGEIITVNVQALLENANSGADTIITKVYMDSKVIVEQTDKVRKRQGYSFGKPVTT